MEDGGVEVLAALGEDLVGGGAGVGRRGEVEGGHPGKRGVILLSGLRESAFGARETRQEWAWEEPAHHHLHLHKK